MSSAQPEAVPDYLETFSLRCEPFADDNDGRFFYAGTALMQRLDLLTHLTQFGDSVILVSGPDGSGKTTLLSRFLAQSNPQWRLCPIDATQFEQFADRLTDAVGGGTFSSEQELLSHWSSESDSSQLLVIVIDNCEHLGQADHEHLGDLLDQATAERIRLILFGTPEAQQRIKQALDRRTPSVTTQLLEVPRLTEEETASYLMYRLAVAGYSGESPFTPTEVRAICKAADGRPADVNRMASDALQERQARTRSRHIPLGGGVMMRKADIRTWGLVAAGVLLVVVYLGWQRLSAPPMQTDPSAGAPHSTPELPLTLPEATPLVAERETPTAPRQSPQPLPEAPPAPAPTPAPGVGSAPPQPSPAGPSPVDSLTSVEAVIADPDDAAGQPQPAPETPVESTPPTAPPPPSPAAEAPASQPQPAATPPSVPAAAAETPASPAAPAPDTGRETAAPESAATAADRPHRESWLLAQAETSYSLQLLGSRSEKSMLDFIRRNKLDERKTAYYRGVHEGAPWYVLMYGIYPTKEAALAGRDRLPEKIRTARPWPRTLASVHEAIRAAQ